MTTTPPDERQAKVVELRALLAEAKNKIIQYKLQIQNKNKIIISLQSNNQEMQRQYEERLLRYQQSLDHAQTLIEKYQLNNTHALQAKENLQKHTNQHLQLIFKTFPTPPSSSTIDEQCEIQKCNQFIGDLNNSEIAKAIKHFTYLYLNALKIKQDIRVYASRKQKQYQENILYERKKNTTLQNQLKTIREKMSNLDKKVKQQMENTQNVKNVKQIEETNLEYIKQMVIKLYSNTRCKSQMALEILTKLLKLNSNEKEMIKSYLK